MTMARYATRPIEVDAVRFDGTREDAAAIVRTHAYVMWVGGTPAAPTIVVQGPTGDYEATAGDWIVTLGPRPIVLGEDEFNEIFDATGKDGG
jgi:hypothetical protein